MIDDFEKEPHAFLSNFFMCTVVHGDVEFPSVEHAYQAAKTLDPVFRDAIKWQKTPAAAKKAGRSVELREDWNEVKIPIMEDLVRDKFTRHDDLRKLLLDTGDAELVEGNWWGDTFWGRCKGVGHNHLGKTLMKIREELRRYPLTPNGLIGTSESTSKADTGT